LPYCTRGRHPAGIGERLSATAAIGVVDDVVGPR